MKRIKLQYCNRHTLVDDKNYRWLNKCKWYLLKDTNTDYAIDGQGNRMHRVILGLQKGDKRQGDHIDHKGLNNQQYNLRICTCSQNLYNRKNKPKGTSKYYGVCFIPAGRGGRKKSKWQSAIKIDNKSIHLGYFNDERKAAEAYDKKAKAEFGNFATLNFPE